MTAITQWAQVADWSSTSVSGGTKTVTGLAWSTGDMIVVVGGVQDLNTSGIVVTPTNANLTFGAALASETSGGANECGIYLYAATAASGQTAQTVTLTITGSWAGGKAHGGAVWVISGAPQGRANITVNLTETAPSLTVAEGSIVIYAGMDWNSTNPPGKTPLTGSGFATERRDLGDGTTYAQYIADWQGTSAGTFSFGPSNYTSLKIAQIAIEILGVTPFITQSQNAAITASRSPALTFAAAVAAGDVVVFWPSSTGTGVAITTPAGWENPLGGNTDVESDSHEICCVAHVVTAAEAGSTTITATNLYDVAQTGNVVGCVVRGVQPNDIFCGAASTFDSGNAITPHILIGLTPDESNGLILSAVAKDATGAYGTTPAAWTQLTTSNTNQGKWLGSSNILSTAGSAFGNTNITPSAGDEYASITVVMRPYARFDRAFVRPSVAVHQSFNW